MWEGMDEPLEDGNWPVVGPSAVPYAPLNQIPRELSRARDGRDSGRVRTRRRDGRIAPASTCSSCTARTDTCCRRSLRRCSTIAPTNTAVRSRTVCDIRSKYFGRCAAYGRGDVPMSVRISATDWVEGGVSGDDAVEIARAFKEAGADLIDVSTGQTSPDAKPVYGRMFQTPYADKIRNEIGIATMAVGNITDADQVNAILAAGRADLVALGRPHLADPFWTLHAAAQLGYPEAAWPVQYFPGKQQLERLSHEPKKRPMPSDERHDIGGKHAVVTGGGRGIGLAIATALAERGAHVSVVSRSALAAQNAGRSFRDEADVTEEAQIAAAFERAAPERSD